MIAVGSHRGLKMLAVVLVVALSLLAATPTAHADITPDLVDLTSTDGASDGPVVYTSGSVLDVDDLSVIAGISDAVYGERRFTTGMDTVWVLGALPTASDDEIVRAVYIDLAIDPSAFTRAHDILSVYAGDTTNTVGFEPLFEYRSGSGAVLVGDTDYDDAVAATTSNSTTIASLNTTDLLRWRLIIPYSTATLMFHTASIAGAHFAANYSLAYKCPAGYQLVSQKYLDDVDTLASLPLSERSSGMCLPIHTPNASLQSFLYSISGIVIFVNLVALSIAYRARETPMIRSMGMLLVAQLFTGNIILAFAGVLFALDPNPEAQSENATNVGWACRMRPWPVGIGAVAILSALLMRGVALIRDHAPEAVAAAAASAKAAAVAASVVPASSKDIKLALKNADKIPPPKQLTRSNSAKSLNNAPSSSAATKTVPSAPSTKWQNFLRRLNTNWMFVASGAAMWLQVGLLITYSSYPLSHLELATLGDRYVLQCSSISGPQQAAYHRWIFVELAIASVLIGVTSKVAWYNRQIRLAFEESRHVTATMIWVCLLACIAVALNYGLASYPDAVMVVRGLAACLAASGILLVLVWPKLWRLLCCRGAEPIIKPPSKKRPVSRRTSSLGGGNATSSMTRLSKEPNSDWVEDEKDDKFATDATIVGTPTRSSRRTTSVGTPTSTSRARLLAESPVSTPSRGGRVLAASPSKASPTQASQWAAWRERVESLNRSSSAAAAVAAASMSASMKQPSPLRARLIASIRALRRLDSWVRDILKSMPRNDPSEMAVMLRALRPHPALLAPINAPPPTRQEWKSRSVPATPHAQPPRRAPGSGGASLSATASPRVGNSQLPPRPPVRRTLFPATGGGTKSGLSHSMSAGSLTPSRTPRRISPAISGGASPVHSLPSSLAATPTSKSRVFSSALAASSPVRQQSSLKDSPLRGNGVELTTFVPSRTTTRGDLAMPSTPRVGPSLVPNTPRVGPSTVPSTPRVGPSVAAGNTFRIPRSDRSAPQSPASEEASLASSHRRLMNLATQSTGSGAIDLRQSAPPTAVSATTAQAPPRPPPPTRGELERRGFHMSTNPIVVDDIAINVVSSAEDASAPAVIARRDSFKRLAQLKARLEETSVAEDAATAAAAPQSAPPVVPPMPPISQLVQAAALPTAPESVVYRYDADDMDEHKYDDHTYGGDGKPMTHSYNFGGDDENESARSGDLSAIIESAPSTPTAVADADALPAFAAFKPAVSSNAPQPPALPPWSAPDTDAVLPVGHRSHPSIDSTLSDNASSPRTANVLDSDSDEESTIKLAPSSPPIPPPTPKRVQLHHFRMPSVPTQAHGAQPS